MSAFPETPLFDIITGNLPYVTDDEHRALPNEILLHEPASALAAGPDGLDVIRRAVLEAAPRLKPGGWLMLETGSGQGGAVSALIRETGSCREPGIVKDLSGKNRFVIAEKKKAKAC